MKKTICILILALTSCTHNELCEEKTFSNHTWKRDGGYISWDNLRLLNDTIIYDIPSFNFHDVKAGKYEFDNGCEGFSIHYFSPDTTVHFSITKNTGNVIWIVSDSGQDGQFHKL